MHCLITAGPTYENLDQVRRLTNFSTGSLGLELGLSLQNAGHQVTVLLGEQATVTPPANLTLSRFGTTENLLQLFREYSSRGVEVVLHAAAVSDFKFGKVWERREAGELVELKSGKLTTRQGTLLAELVPTPKLIGELRVLFPKALLVGWKFEVDGTQPEVLAKAMDQLTQNHTDACVANGPAYGNGFGWLTRDGPRRHFEDRPSLFAFLAEELDRRQKKS